MTILVFGNSVEILFSLGSSREYFPELSKKAATTTAIILLLVRIY